MFICNDQLNNILLDQIMSENGNEHEQDYSFTEGEDGGDQFEAFVNEDGEDETVEEVKADKTADLSDLTDDPVLI